VTESDFSSFDDALKKLELEEEDLKRLISAGEIRAFREGSNMRLRVEDVSKVADQLGIGGSIGEDAGEVLEVEDLVLDELDDAGMATTQLSEEDTLLDDAVEELEVAAEKPVKAAPSRRSGRAAAAVAPEAGDEGGGMRAALIVTCVLMIFAIPFAIGMVAGKSSGITAGIVEMMGK
jgi:prefoldin subunit 5